MHPNEIILVQQPSTNPTLLVPTRDMSRVKKDAEHLSLAHYRAFQAQLARQMDILHAAQRVA